MAVIKIPGHSSFKLARGPAASIARIDAQRKKQGLGPLTITSALRTTAQQLALIARWFRGGTYNRPPYLYKPAMSPPFPHASGKVIDTPDRAWMLKYGKDHGWRQPFAYDIVHFQYYSDLDKKKPKVPITDTRKAYYEPHLKRYYLSGYVRGKSYLAGTRRLASRDRWVKNFGKGTPYELPLSEIRAKAGRA